ncbi:MAG TPA: biotin--[acetyl-CoA-carboxylase] ligase [Fibrobacteraceae bacterium]|nr:biotin--[acetyl-CoA-carboxylase] ligase [Fibrobacteraceae bacterium]
MDFNAIFSSERDFPQWGLQGLDGAPARLFQNINSTNRWLREHASECVPGTLALANQQSAGRGRFDRVWCSPVGKNLYFSLLLAPSGVSVTQWPHLTQVAAITLAQLYQDLGLEAHVKWPNDVLWNRHKMCGLLAERAQGAWGDALVLGIGINVNSEPADFADLGRLAASLRIALGKPLNREALLAEYLKRLASAFLCFAQKGVAPWLEIWRTMPNFVGSKARLVLVDKTLAGTIAGIRDDGSLWFLPDGASEPLSVYSGDLEV